MTFQEDFPSLIKDESSLEALGKSDDSIQDAIQEHCLDKQKVKDALHKFGKEIGYNEPLQCSLDVVFQELGLDK